MKLRPSEMLVSFLIHLQDFTEVYYKNEIVEAVEQLEYDKFIIRRTYSNDEEIRCDGLMISEFLDIIKDFCVR